MEVKGTSAINTRTFVRERHGEEGYERFLQGLSEPARRLYSDEEKVLASAWYPAEPAFFEPARRICELFFDGDVRGSAWELGRFSASLTLRGVYRVFLRIGSPGRMLARATPIFESFYRPGEVHYHPAGTSEGTLEFLHIDEYSGLWEYRLGGFIEKALELTGAKDGRVEVTDTLSEGANAVRIRISWS